MLADDVVADSRLTAPEDLERHVRNDMKFRNIGQSFDQTVAYTKWCIERSADVAKAQRFVLSPQIVEAAWELSETGKAVEASRDHLFTPARLTWIEWVDDDNLFGFGSRMGVLLEGPEDQGSTRHVIGVGSLHIALRERAADWKDQTRLVEAFTYDFPGDSALFKTKNSRSIFDAPRPEQFLEPEGYLVQKRIHALDFGRLSHFIGCVLALINTPRIAQVIEHDVSKLNKARMRANKIPLLSFKDLTISPDSGWVSETEMRKRTEERREHHVRAHLRLRRRGTVELVSSHTRGNRDKGHVIHRHVVRRAEEEAGAWKGPPQCGDQILTPGLLDGLVDDKI